MEITTGKLIFDEPSTRHRLQFSLTGIPHLERGLVMDEQRQAEGWRQLHLGHHSRCPRKGGRQIDPIGHVQVDLTHRTERPPAGERRTHTVGRPGRMPCLRKEVAYRVAEGLGLRQRLVSLDRLLQREAVPA